jgi:putative membrane protein
VTRAVALLGLAGLAVATALVAREGVATVLVAAATAGTGVLWASAFHVVPMALNARAWQLLAGRGGRSRRCSLAFFARLVWVREAVNALLPVARVGGEVASTRLMVRGGIRARVAVASLVVDMTVGLATQAVFTLAGIALLVRRSGGDRLAGQAVVAFGIAAALAALFAAVQRRGLFAMAATVARFLTGGRLAAIVGGAAPLDRAVRMVYRRPRRVVACALWQFAGWAAGAGEIWLALAFLGHPSSLADALLVEALVQGASSIAFAVPGALGVQEGAFVALGATIGLGADTALALALLRRARDLLVFVPGLLVYQAAEGRTWVRRLAGSPRDVATRRDGVGGPRWRSSS